MSKVAIFAVSVVRAKHGYVCSDSDCKKEIRNGKPAVKIGRDIFCLGCAEKRGYHNLYIPFDVEPDYLICEVGKAETCADCHREIATGTTCFFHKYDKVYFCEECGVNKHKYPRLQKKEQKKEHKKE